MASTVIGELRVRANATARELHNGQHSGDPLPFGVEQRSW